MKNKGFIFSFELVASLFATLLILLVVLSQTNYFVKKNLETEKQLEFERKAIFLADSLVKNFDKENPILGIAFQNHELKRTENNVIDKELFEKSQWTQKNFSGIKIIKIELKTKNNENIVVFEENTENEKRCIVLERFVLVNSFEDFKALVAVTVCEE